MVPGVFSLFLHYTKGKYSKNKASDLATFFILGTESVTIVLFLSIYFIINSSIFSIEIIENQIFAWIVAGIFLALAALFAICYYQKGAGTKLFISRSFVNNYYQKIKTAKSRSDAFVLGFTATIPELIFTLPLYIVSAVIITYIAPSSLERAGLIFLFAFVAILPLLIAHVRYTIGNTLADTIRFRIKNKNFFRFTTAFSFLLMAVLIIIGALV